MKRLNNLYEKIYSLDNLRLADEKAQKGKSKQYGVIIHNRNKEHHLIALQEMLISKKYKTSTYTTFNVYEPKERVVFRLPYFPDRILHHAIMNILEPVFVGSFTSDTYSCIKGRGIHAVVRKLKLCLKDVKGTPYCLKIDIKKFYPSVNHEILKQLIRRKIKDNDLLWLLDEIIDSADGLPIGNYLSQYLANFYLTYFDHWIKEPKAVKYYFRYADDIVILSCNKTYLRNLLTEIKNYLSSNLNLEVNKNFQIFPVSARSIDFVGYRFYHSYTLLRKYIKKRFAKKLKRNHNERSIAAYWGWAKHCNSRHLLKKLMPDDKYIQRLRN